MGMNMMGGMPFNGQFGGMGGAGRGGGMMGGGGMRGGMMGGRGGMNSGFAGQGPAKRSRVDE